MTEITPPTPLRKALKIFFFIGIFLSTLLFFTLMRLPEEEIKNSITGYLNQALAQQNYSLTAEKSSFSVIKGLQLTLSGITLTSTPSPYSLSESKASASSVKLEQLSITPSIIPLLTGRIGGTLRLTHGEGTLLANVTLDPKGKGDTDLTLDFDHFSFANKAGKNNLFPFISGNMQGNAMLNGRGSFTLPANGINALSGELKLSIERLTLDSQTVNAPFGALSLPKLQVAQSTLQCEAKNGKVFFKTVKIGSSMADDINATVTGDIILGRMIDLSTLNITTRFSFSPSLMKSFSLLEMLLAAGKNADGSFSYKLSGPLGSPISMPDKG